MNLLFVSIKHDGYTQPVVTYYDEKKDKYIIVDGFHRYATMKNSKYLRELNHGYLPVVVIDKSIDDRMASTVRHNRARGTHSVQGMTDIVYKMLNDGWDDARICNELGMELLCRRTDVADQLVVVGKGMAVALAHAVEHLHGFIDDIGADSVALDNSDILVHRYHSFPDIYL